MKSYKRENVSQSNNKKGKFISTARVKMAQLHYLSVIFWIL